MTFGEWDWDDEDEASVDPDGGSGPSVDPQPIGRSVFAGFAIGTGVTLVMVAISFSLIAMPLFAFARADVGRGLDHPAIRTGLLYVALPVGLLVGVAAGTVVSLWLMRGGRMPTDRLPFHET